MPRHMWRLKELYDPDCLTVSSHISYVAMGMHETVKNSCRNRNMTPELRWAEQTSYRIHYTHGISLTFGCIMRHLIIQLLKTTSFLVLRFFRPNERCVTCCVLEQESSWRCCCAETIPLAILEATESVQAEILTSTKRLARLSWYSVPCETSSRMMLPL